MSGHLLLFDIDGTLIHTDGVGRRAMHQAARRLFGDHFTFEGVAFGGRLDHAIFADAAQRNAIAMPEAHHHRFREAYLVELEKALAASGTEALPGVHPLLDHLHQLTGRERRVVLGLVSGNYRPAAALKLAAAAIDPNGFRVTAFGDEAPTRSALVHQALWRYRMASRMRGDVKRVIVIGDTPHDIDCARAHGCVAFAVATGPFSFDELKAAKPDVLVPDLSDPAPLLELIDESSQRR